MTAPTADSHGGVLESGVLAPRKKEVQMTNAAVARLRKRWALFVAWVAAMDYSAADYTNDRIGRLEREVGQLKDELRRTRMSAAAADGGCEPVRHPAEPE